jgi:hypothetical protein
VARRVFGKKRSGIRVLIKRLPVKVVGNHIFGGLRLRGLIALQEEGGSTRPHVIRPKLKRALMFQGARGTVFTRLPIHHPGGRLPRLPIVTQRMERSEPLFRGEIDVAHRDLITEKLGR